MVKKALSDLEPRKVFQYFEEISAIPRGSGNEKGISDHILAWARERGLAAVQDEYLNLIIKKPASGGYENADAVLLQAHLDMVCEKKSDSCHDFTQDPIPLRVEGDMIISAAGTTLGADNGIGVAYCMAVLDDDSLAHPPLEILLTTEEETTFNGAESVSPRHFSARRLINLDQAVDDEVLAGSCGGEGAILRLPLRYMVQAPRRPQETAFSLRISGLPGGHSGEDIHRGHGNAIQLLARALCTCRTIDGLRLADLSGGTGRTAIPREAEAVITVDRDKETELRQSLEKLEAVFQTEYRAAAPGLRLELKRLDAAAGLPSLTEDALEKLLAFLYLMPDGIMQMNGAAPGVVESSINLGVARLTETGLELTAEMRNAYDSTTIHMEDRLSFLCRTFGAGCEFFTKYRPWSFNPHSPLREKAAEVYEGEFGKPLKTVVVHAGIECGSLLAKLPDLDAISIGPNCWFFHSPEERMSISSVGRAWQFLVKLLAELR